jgi:pimeloyl-ACP methyl ester carboxylesterase
MRHAALASVAVTLAALCLLGAGGASGDAGGYCRPAATHYDPKDVPEQGSAPVEVPGVRSEPLRVLGVTTRLLEAGRPRNRVAAVFMHGNPGSGADWAELLPRVAGERGRAVAIDMPGFGHAEDVWDLPATLGAAERWFAAALRKLGIRQVHLVAHDLGGPVGLEWGSNRPRRLRSVTLIDTGLLPEYRHHDLARIWRTPEEGEAFMLAMNRSLWHAGIQNGQTKPLPEEFVDRMYDDFDRETRCAILKIYRSTDEPEIHAFSRRQARVLSRWRSRPALVIWGADDPYIPAATAYQQRSGFPKARIEIFEDSGHWPFVDFAVRTRKLIVPFIRAAVARDRLRSRR